MGFVRVEADLTSTMAVSAQETGWCPQIVDVMDKETQWKNHEVCLCEQMTISEAVGVGYPTRIH